MCLALELVGDYLSEQRVSSAGLRARGALSLVCRQTRDGARHRLRLDRARWRGALALRDRFEELGMTPERVASGPRHADVLLHYMRILSPLDTRGSIHIDRFRDPLAPFGRGRRIAVDIRTGSSLSFACAVTHAFRPRRIVLRSVLHSRDFLIPFGVARP